MTDTNRSLGRVLDRLSEAEEGESVSVGDVLDALADRSLGMIVAALGLVAALPVIGAIPGVSVVVAALVLVAIGQTLMGRSANQGLWMPAPVRERAVGVEEFDRGLETVRPATRWIDARLKPRLTWLTEGPGRGALLIAASAVLALSMVPLAIVPGAVFAPALGLIALGLAMMTRDGLLAIAGYALAGATGYIFIWIA